MISKPRAPAPFSVVPSLAPGAGPGAGHGAGGAGLPGLRLPPVSPRSQVSDGSPREGGMIGSPRRRRKSLRTTATDLPEVSDERSPRDAVHELQKQRERRRSSVSFLDDSNDELSPVRAVDSSPLMTAQASNRSMKSMTLDDDATGASKVHYVKKKKARSTASSASMEAAAKAAVKEVREAKAERRGQEGRNDKGAKKGGDGGGFLGILGGSSRSERIEHASDRVRKDKRLGAERDAAEGQGVAAPSPRRSRDDGCQGLGQWSPEEPEAEPDLETWQLEERKLQAAMERVRMGLSALEVDPTEEQKREETQLQRELQERNFTDRQALAYCLIKKLGSLSNAFKYLTSRQDKFSKVTWETALLVLHLHVVLLTGRNKNEIFQAMSEDDQTVTKESWDLYFAGLDLEGELLSVATPAMALTAEPCSRPPRRCSAGAETALGPGGGKTAELGMDMEAQPVTPLPPPAPAAPATGAPATGAPATSISEGPATSPRRRSSVRPDEEKDSAKTRKFDRRRSSTRRLSADKFESAPPIVEVAASPVDEEFLLRISKMLEEITPDNEVLNEGMTRQQKALLMAKARERNLTAPAWRQGVLVLQEDKLSKKLREDMASLACGLSPIQVPKSLENFAGVLAEEQGVTLTHRSGVDEDHLVIDMLKEDGSNEELLEAAEAYLKSLQDGEIRSLQLPATSRFRSALVKVAKDRSLPSATAPDGHLQIGNLHLFVQELDSIIENLEENQEHDFGSDLHVLHRQLVREKSIKAGLKMTEEETMKIRRAAQFMLDSKGDTLEEQRALTEAVFNRYATGRLAHQIFLRRGDLIRLLAESPPLSGERPEDFKARIGEVFDDTLQLQLDVLGQNYGLSKEYFQVFLTKASNEISWRPRAEVLEAFMESIPKTESNYLT